MELKQEISNRHTTTNRQQHQMLRLFLFIFFFYHKAFSILIEICILGKVLIISTCCKCGQSVSSYEHCIKHIFPSLSLSHTHFVYVSLSLSLLFNEAERILSLQHIEKSSVCDILCVFSLILQSFASDLVTNKFS